MALTLDEVAVAVDDHFAPGSVQLIFLTSTEMPIDCREWIDNWWAKASAVAEDELALLSTPRIFVRQIRSRWQNTGDDEDLGCEMCHTNAP